MHQHITVAQLLSLTPAQQERLREWWVPQVGDLVHGRTDLDSNTREFFISVEEDDLLHDLEDGEYIGYNCEKSDCLPLLTVGQCMELLRDNGTDRYDKWPMMLACLKIADEPIDALFAAVREVL